VASSEDGRTKVGEFVYGLIRNMPNFFFQNILNGLELRLPRDTLYQQKLALTSPTSGSRSVGIVRSRSKATVFFLFWIQD
jgi:hypothetical protein